MRELLRRRRQTAAVIGRTGHRIIVIAHQFFDRQARITAAAKADPDVDRIARQVLQLAARLQHHFDIRMQVDEFAQPRRQPARSKRRYRGHRQPLLASAGAQRTGRAGDLLQGFAHRQREALALRRDRYPLAVAGKQGHAQVLLQRPHLMADCAMGQVNLVRRT